MSAADRLAQIRARVAAVTAPLPDEARMDAYYYGFDRTGVGSVDAILSAVAIAGKAFHGTASWTDDDPDVRDYFHGRPGLPDADSADDLIQAGANQAAERVRAVESDIPALLSAVEAVLAMHSPRAEAVLSDPDCLREECDHEGACPLGGSVTVCAACWIVAEESYHYFCEQGIPDEVLHPCDTVRAITEALA